MKSNPSRAKARMNPTECYFMVQKTGDCSTASLAEWNVDERYRRMRSPAASRTTVVRADAPEHIRNQSAVDSRYGCSATSESELRAERLIEPVTNCEIMRMAGFLPCESEHSVGRE